MDEIAFYNHALFSKAILSSYTSSLETTDPDLFIYYTLEEAYNTTESSSLPPTQTSYLSWPTASGSSSSQAETTRRPTSSSKCPRTPLCSHMCVAPLFAHAFGPLCSHMCVAHLCGPFVRACACPPLLTHVCGAQVLGDELARPHVRAQHRDHLRRQVQRRAVRRPAARNYFRFRQVGGPHGRDRRLRHPVRGALHQLASCPWQPVLLVVHGDLYKGGRAAASTFFGKQIV